MSLPFPVDYPRLHCCGRETLCLAPFGDARKTENVSVAQTPTGSLTFILKVEGLLQLIIPLSKSGSSPSS